MSENLEKQESLPQEQPIIHFFEDQYSSVIATLKLGANQLTDLVKYYNTIGYGEIKFEELKPLINETSIFIYDKMNVDEKISIPGFAVDKEKHLQMLTKPAWYFALIEVTAEIREFFSKNSTLSTSRHLPTSCNNLGFYYHFNEKGEVEINSEKMQYIRNQFEERANTTAARKVYEFANKYHELLKETGILEISNGTGLLFYDFLQNLVPYSMITKGVKIDTKYMSGFNSNSFR